MLRSRRVGCVGSESFKDAALGDGATTALTDE
jgi:hypothetical protein